MLKTRITALVLLIIGIGIGAFVFLNERPDSKYPFHLGLDLSGGSYLTYTADLSEIDAGGEREAMSALRDVIERRINIFGVSEPSVQSETISLSGAGKEHRLVVELPGVTDLGEATEMIGQTPLLEFKTERPEAERDQIIAAIEDFQNTLQTNPDAQPAGLALEDPFYVATDLTGRYLRRSTLQFSQGAAQGGSGVAGSPVIALQFDTTGSKLFEEITTANVGKTVAIYLDGLPISTPNVQQPIIGGEAVITGQFTPDEARQLVGRLNSGALPVPISLISTQTIGPSLGADAAQAGIMASLLGLVLIAGVMLFWYRLQGLLAAVSLVIYGFVMLALFKLIPVTLSAAGIAGFIISLGIAVDANILIFERVKEELLVGKKLPDALREGFSRAWPSIRDANISSIISAVIIFLSGAPLIKGFALTFGIGVVVSMVTAITVTRIFLYAIAGDKNGRIMRFLYSTGLRSGQPKS